jgi:flagellar biosynthesis/type III secretory pathway M-ring protein FliF/YscJ
MFKFFFVILPLVVLFFIFLFGFSVLRGIFRLFFGGTTQNTYKEQQEKQRTDSSSQKKHEKVFKKEEGEYVDYEEIKNPDAHS